MKKLIEKLRGVDVKTFTCLEGLSHYYSFNGHCLYGSHYRNGTTFWYLIRGSMKPIYLGQSEASGEAELLYIEL